MEEDKLTVLNRIFGSDLTESVIATTLQEHGEEFDPTVEKLLMLPSNKVRPPEPAPLDGKAQENVHRLHNMFTDLSASVVATVYEQNKRDVEGTVDALLNLTSKEDDTEERRKAEVARQEQELRAYEEFKRMQDRLKAEERKAAEAQRKAIEEAQRKAAEEKAKEEEERRKREEQTALERQQALVEQEKALQAFQEKKKAEESKRAETEEARRRALEAKKAELEKRLALEKARIEEAKRMEEKARETEREKAKRMEEEKRVQEQLEAAKKLSEAKNLKVQKEKEEEEAKRVREEEEKARKALEERKGEEDRIMKRRFEEERAMLQEQRARAEAERKLLEERVKQERAREEQERKRRHDEERRFREEQESARKAWEEKMKQLESEREHEEERRAEMRKAEEDLRRAAEERVKQEADMRRILEIERLKLDEQRKRVEEEKGKAEGLRIAMEQASARREEEEARKRKEEDERRREEEQRAEEERAREEEERKREEMKKKMAEEQFAASAVLVAPVPKVSISASVEGNEIRGQWELVEGALPSSQAWVGVFPRRSNNTYAGFLYVSGTSGDFHFKSLTPGHYEVRFFTSKPVTSRIAESEPLLVGPKIRHFVLQQQGDQLVLEYSLEAPASPSTWDWVGIFERSQRRNKDYISSTYGNPTGVISAPLPRTPGEYHARLFAAGSKYNEQATLDFVVVDNDCVTTPDMATRDTPLKASWVLRTVEPTSSDWIGLFAVGETSNSKYLSSAYTTGHSTGEVNIAVPKDIAPGVYELRLFANKVGKYTTFKTSGPIHIASP